MQGTGRAAGGVLTAATAADEVTACLADAPGAAADGMLGTLGQGEACLGLIALCRREDGDQPTTADRDQVRVLARVACSALGVLLAEKTTEPGKSTTVRIGKVQEAIHILLQIRRSGIPTATAASLALLSRLAGRLGLTPQQVDSLQYAATLHDAGMARVEDEILMGAGALTWDERDEVERHVEQGVALMAPLLVEPGAEAIIRHHHERVDGKGYPEGLRDSEIPCGARVLAVIDAWFSLTEGRPYRTGVSAEDAMHEIRSHSGTQFDSRVIHEFESLLIEEGLLAGTPENSGPTR